MIRPLMLDPHVEPPHYRRKARSLDPETRPASLARHHQKAHLRSRVDLLLPHQMASVGKAISSPVPVAWYPTLSFLMLAVGLVLTSSFFIYEATSSQRSRCLTKELLTGAVASVFLGFGSLFLLLATGVYV